MTSDDEPKRTTEAGAETETEISEEESTRPDASYAVGYGRPPKHTRFKPGQSGNARGRPKGEKNLKTYLKDVLNETIDVREGGRPKTITKLEAFVTSLINGSIKGNGKSATLLLNMIMRLLDTGANDAAGEEELTDADWEVLRANEERILKRLAANQTPNPTPAGESEAAARPPEEGS